MCSVILGFVAFLARAKSQTTKQLFWVDRECLLLLVLRTVPRSARAPADKKQTQAYLLEEHMQMQRKSFQHLCFSWSEAELQITDTSPIFKWSFYNYIAMPYGNTTGFLIATSNDSESPALTTKLLRALHPSSTEELGRDWQSHHYHWQSNSFMTSCLLRNKFLWPK